MQARVHPSIIAGTLTAPASKSAMQRACAAALIRGGTTILHNPGHAADDQAALRIIQQLGALVEKKEEELRITSNGIQVVNGTLDCGESGLSVRMFTSIASLTNHPVNITGSGSLVRRPLSFFEELLPQLGVTVQSNGGHLPIQVQGPMKPADITVDGSLSSQYLTGLLLAYAAADAADVTIQVKNLNSKPYIDLTLKLMQDFGLAVPVNKAYESFYFPLQSNRSAVSSPFSYHVEGDWSGAAFLMVAGALTGPLEIQGLDVFSTQADRAILQALMQAGAVMSIEPARISIQRSALRAFQFNAVDCPDLFPPLVALAAYANGTSVIEGVNRLTHKESNRALTLQEEFGKLGIEIRLQDDLMLITGGTVTGANVVSHHDHRIAMALAVAALRATGPVYIEGAEAVNKSYPDFWKHFAAAGGNVSLTESS